MKKIETIWHHILHEAVTNHNYRHTQQDIATRFKYSLSTVHHALEVPSQLGAIRKESKFFILEDFKKLLYYWASVRRLERDLIYKALAKGSISSLEGLAVPGSIFACYSAATHYLGEPPTDYAKVYWYLNAEELKMARSRFPAASKKKAEDNVFFLKMPPVMKQYGDYTTRIQTFVDIWNLRDWYARDFCKVLEEKIDGLLS